MRHGERKLREPGERLQVWNLGTWRVNGTARELPDMGVALFPLALVSVVVVVVLAPSVVAIRPLSRDDDHLCDRCMARLPTDMTPVIMA